MAVGPEEPSIPHFSIHLIVLLPLAGVLAYIALLQVGTWRTQREDPVPLWSSAWCVAALVFVFGRLVQRGAETPLVGAVGSRIQIAAAIALAVLSYGAAQAVGVPLPRRRVFPALVVVGVALAVLACLSKLVVADEAQLRADLLGNVYYRPSPTPLRSLALAFVAGVVGYVLVRGFRAGLISDPDRRRTVRWLSVILGPLVVLELVQATQIARSVQVIEFGAALAAIFMNQEVMARYHRMRATSERLQRSEASFRALIEAAPDAIMVHRGGKFVFANAAAAAFLGYGRASDLLEHFVDDVLADAERTSVDSGLSVVPASSSSPAAELQRFVRADGQFVMGEVVRIPLIFDGEAAVVTIARDVTERQALERKLRHADRMASVGTLAAGVAHEINNPLSYVMINLDEAVVALSRSAAHSRVDAKFVELLTEAQDGAERIRRVVRDVTAFARHGEDDVGPVEIRTVLDTALALTRNEIRHRATLVTDYADGLWILTNHGRLVQVFVNLLVNAAQAVANNQHGPSEVRVSARASEGSVVVEIRDNGPGLTEESRRHAFDPFFTTKPVGEGTGLGLAICHGIVTRLGGTISLDNHAGGGAVARVVLPSVAQEVERSEMKAPEPERIPSRFQLLIVDDDPIVGRGLKRLLHDHDVTVATSAIEALELTRQQIFDVILCDVMMPHLSGVEFYRMVLARAAGDEERILFMTGGAFTGDMRSFLTGFPDRVLEKPFDAHLLRRRVDERVAAVRRRVNENRVVAAGG